MKRWRTRIGCILILISSNKPCLQPQTCKHLIGVENMIIQNKIDLIKEENEKEHIIKLKHLYRK